MKINMWKPDGIAQKTVELLTRAVEAGQHNGRYGVDRIFRQVCDAVDIQIINLALDGAIPAITLGAVYGDQLGLVLEQRADDMRIDGLDGDTALLTELMVNLGIA